MECFCRNPCLAKNILLVSKCFLTCMSTIFPTILDRTGYQEIGLQLSLTDSPPLCTGITLVILHMSGKVAVISNLLYIIGTEILMV